MTVLQKQTVPMLLGTLALAWLIAVDAKAGAEAPKSNDWETGTLAEAGFDAAFVDRLDAAFEEGALDGLHGVVIVRHGRLRLERYYAGEDERWGQPLGMVEHAADRRHDLRSVSKSIVGLLYGIALDEGLVPPVEAPLLEQFSRYQGLVDAGLKQTMTIHHALTMTLGLNWNENLPYTDPRNSEIAMEFAPDRYAYILGQPMQDEPGERWVYSGGATALLGGLISAGSRQPLLPYARERLFAPLGIEDVEWVEGADGEAAAASGLRMRPRDLARIGQMLLNRGEWHGTRVVSEDWLETAFYPHAKIGEGMDYGYQWWLTALPGGERMIAAFGNGGQRLFIIPALDLVVVIIAGRYNQPDEGRLPDTVLNDFILEALTVPPTACESPSQAIDEKGFVSIGGIEQWVTVKGDSCANPIILFLHGGPGNPLSPYSDELYGAWVRDFTLVQWDQRGSGMTYGRNPQEPGEPITIAQMSSDGIELAAYLVDRFGKDKVILTGSSWGSVLGVHMASARPDLFHAYLGVSQVVSHPENEIRSYFKLLDLAHAANDVAALTVLEEVGEPPWENPRSFGKVRRVVRQYESKVATPPPEHWWTPAAEYATPTALADYEAGEEFSFLAFVGLRGDGILSTVDLPRLGTEFAVPMFFVHGEHDLLITPGVTQRYYDSLKAPQKSFVLVENAGHDTNQELVDVQYKLLMEQIMPLTR